MSDDVFSDFGREFVKYYIDDYRSKTNGLCIKTDDNTFILYNNSEQAVNYFKKLYKRLNGEHYRSGKYPSFTVKELPEIKISKQYTFLSCFRPHEIVEELCVLSDGFRRVSITRTSDKKMLISVSGENEDKAVRLAKEISESINGYPTISYPIQYFGKHTCEFTVTGGYDHFETIYWIKPNIKNIIMQNINVENV